MRIRASFTVENAVIIPLFIAVIVVFVMVTLDTHDQIVVRSVDAQVAMKVEQEMGKDSEKLKDEIFATAATNIKVKCVLDESVSEQSVEERLTQKELITKNRQPDFIRVISAGLKLLDK